MSTSAAQQPSPQLFFQTINAHMRTEALKAGIELEVFTAIGEGNTTPADIAKRCQASEKEYASSAITSRSWRCLPRKTVTTD